MSQTKRYFEVDLSAVTSKLQKRQSRNERRKIFNKQSKQKQIFRDQEAKLKAQPDIVDELSTEPVPSSNQSHESKLKSSGKWQLPTSNESEFSLTIGDGPGIKDAQLTESFKKTDFKTYSGRIKYSQQLDKFSFGQIQSSRAKILLPEQSGFIIPDEGEETYTIRQRDIVASVDIASASKHFNLKLPKFGPYRINYTRNGRNLLLGGRMGHLAAFNWFTKELQCEVNVMDVVKDVQWLHNETMYAVAQKKWTYIYDCKGTELHCLKLLHNVQRLDFLPYHYLLVASTSTSFLHWLDVSIGKLVASFPTGHGPIDVLCHNPSNAIVHCGTSKGVVNLWSPNEKEPLVKMLCHRAPVRAISVDSTGRYMATAGSDNLMKIWDLRKYEELWSLKSLPVSHMVFSQQSLLGCSTGDSVKVFKDVCQYPVSKPYLVHQCDDVVSDLQFCPFEDVLGVGHQSGFESLLIPGAGEPNIDALEANPFQTKRQRREMEVRSLLDKIQPELITLDPQEIVRVNPDREKENLEKKIKFLYSKETNADLLASTTSPATTKKKRKPLKAKVKRAVRENRKKEILRQKELVRQELIDMGVLKKVKKKSS